MAETINADYLVVGAGAMGMAFADALFDATKATIAIVDRYHCPGGHWTTAYPFVRLHQPSAFYGVNSRPLGANKIDEVGWNKGLYELATGDEVCAYFAQVMFQQLLPSGRVTYYPKCEYTGGGNFHSIVSDRTYRVAKGTRIVDATFSKVAVPSMRPPPFQISPGVDVVTPNNMTKISRSYANYTVVGAGKTGIDACLWMLGMGVEPDRITWIMPRDAWLFDRANNQPGPEFIDSLRYHIESQRNAVMAATSVDDLLSRLEACGALLRLDRNVWPTMFRCGTVTRVEFEALKKIQNIVRKGRLLAVRPEEMKLENGTQPAVPDTLYIDCSANSLEKRKPVPVFRGNTITLQPVRLCQQVFSAALIAHVEAAYDDDKLRNNICCPIPHPYQAMDWLIVNLLNHRNTVRWSLEPKTTAWLSTARLDWFGNWQPVLPEDPEQRRVAHQKVRAMLQALQKKLHKLLLDQPEEQAAEAREWLAHMDEDYSYESTVMHSRTSHL